MRENPHGKFIHLKFWQTIAHCSVECSLFDGDSDLSDPYELMDTEPAATPVQQQGKGKENVSRIPHRGRERKQDDDDETFRDPKELTAQMLVQQVSCNTLAYRMILIGLNKAWAQAVKGDGTVYLISSHRDKCIRNLLTHVML